MPAIARAALRLRKEAPDLLRSETSPVNTGAIVSGKTARWIAAAIIVLTAWAWAEPAQGEALVQTRRWTGSVHAVHPFPGQEHSLLLQTADRLFVLRAERGHWTLHETWPLPREAPGGVVMADITGNGQVDLAVGSGGAGATYVYTRRSGQWQLLGRTDYIWTSVASLQAGRISQRGRHDLLVTGADGRVYLFGWTFGEFSLRWASPPPDGSPWHAAVADLTGSGQDDVILWRPGGYVGVWRWTDGTLAPVWENYPWGLIAGLTVGDVDRDGLPDIVLNTSQGLLYAFGWDAGEFRTKRHLAHEHLPFPLLTIQGQGRGGGSGQGAQLLASDGSRLFWYRIGEQSLESRWASGPVGAIRGAMAAPGGGGFFVWDEEEGLRLLQPAPDSVLRLEWFGQERSLAFRPVVEEGIVWLSARDLSDLLGWRLAWEPGTRRLTLVRWPSYFVGKVGAARVMTERGPRQLQAPVRIVDDRVYVPYDALVVMGFDVAWDELTRTLKVASRP